MLAKVKIVSDGTPAGTQILLDGVPLHGIKSVAVDPIEANNQALVGVRLHFAMVDLELDGELRTEADK